MHRVAMPFLYPLRKNHIASEQKAVMAVSMMAITVVTCCVTMYSTTDNSQNQKWEKICVMA